MRPKEISTNSLCRLFLLLPSCFPFPAGETSPSTLLGLWAAGLPRETVRLQTASPELFLPYSSVFPYPTAEKRGAVILHLQARASSMQVSTLLLSCQPWLILQFSTSRLLEAERFCGSLGVVQGHVHLQTTFDSGCERLPVLLQSMGCVGHWLGSSLWLHGQNPVLSLQ